MNKTSFSLCSLIKKISQEKGRPLKIVCDWDECLQPNNPNLIYKVALKAKLLSLPSFKEFFKVFWEKSEGEFRSHGTARLNTNIKEVEDFKKDRKTEFEKIFREVKRNFEYYNEIPFLSIAEELLQCLKEGFISEILVISSFHKKLSDYNEKNFHPVKGDFRKMEKFRRSFGKFPNSSLYMYENSRDNEPGKNNPYRWELIMKNRPDFDIFIDDNPNIIQEAVKNIADKEKIYVMPDYKINRHLQAPNIYHVKTSVSDLKNEDFTQAAAEYQAKQANKWLLNKTTEPESEVSDQIQAKLHNWTPWIIGGLITFIVIIICLFFRKKRK